MLKWKKEKDAYGRIEYWSEDRRYSIARTSYHPIVGYGHSEKGSWWMLSRRDEKLGVAPDYMVNFRSYDTFDRAKRMAQEMADRIESA